MWCLVASLARVRRLALAGSLGKLLGLALSRGNILYLFGTALGLFLLLLFLGLFDGGVAVGLADGFGLAALGHDLFPAGPHNGALDLGGAAGAPLDGLLGRALLVQAAEKDGPVELARVLFRQKVGFGLSVQQTERLAVHADENLAATRVNLAARECADLSPT